MPLTPFHLAAGLPVRRWISLKAFILVNLLIDIEPAVVLFFNMDSLGYPIHGWTHTLGGVTTAAAVTLFLSSHWCFKKKIIPWIYGTVFGAYSHLLLDALVHSDVQPFAPFLSGNPLYMDAYHIVSALCAAILTYYLAKWVESLGVGKPGTGRIRNLWRRFFPGTPSE